jgi:serine protease Do
MKMKRILLPAIITVCCGFVANNSFAQTKNNTKNEEIIIQKNNDSDAKTVIVIDSNVVTINGEPLNDYDGNVKVIRRKFRRDNSLNSLSPVMSFGYNNFSGNRAFLGVLSEKSDKGAVIKDVTKGSGAEKAGLQKSDVITKVGDKTIAGPDDLSNVIKSYKPGDEIKISYLRSGKKKTAKVTLGKADNMMSFNFNNDSSFRGERNFNFRMPEVRGFNNLPRDFKIFNRNQPKIGLRIQETEEGNGVKILNVEEGSAAEKAGLKKDDIITEINGEKVNSVPQILSQINQPENKNDFKIKAKRNNSVMDFDVKIPKQLRSADL